MLFNSYEFIFLFLPLALVLYFGLARWGQKSAAMAMVGAGLFFYAWWRLEDLYVLLGSITVNFVISRGMIHLLRKKSARARLLLGLGVAFNLWLLILFKYTNFILESVQNLFSVELPMSALNLPLGISFFTFTQLAYLIDLYRRQAEPFSFFNYSMFVTYFPHLIAGPILHHREMAPQFSGRRAYLFSWDSFSLGLTLFIIGLTKKVFIADSLSAYVAQIFDGGRSSLGFAESWLAVLSYTLQIYFDFSGYSDMAVGLARMFSVEIPFNFDSPYKAKSIIDFWRRWHITLSRFLRDYLYIPLGGNQKGSTRRYVNLMTTMALGGLWHGASWNFLVWGLLHGFYLLVNHYWRAQQLWFKLRLANVATFLSAILTFVAVMLAWVFFRAVDFSSAFKVILGMLGAGGGRWSRLSDNQSYIQMAIVAVGLAIAFWAPSTKSWAAKEWRPSWIIAILTAVVFVACLIKMRVFSSTEFIYFNF